MKKRRLVASLATAIALVTLASGTAPIGSAATLPLPGEPSTEAMPSMGLYLSDADCSLADCVLCDIVAWQDCLRQAEVIDELDCHDAPDGCHCHWSCVSPVCCGEDETRTTKLQR
jgi:hypothetical protein